MVNKAILIDGEESRWRAGFCFVDCPTVFFLTELCQRDSVLTRSRQAAVFFPRLFRLGVPVSRCTAMGWSGVVLLMSHQDWTPVVWNKAPSKGGGKARQGEATSVEKKFLAGQNKVNKRIPPNAAKIEQETEDFRVERVGKTFRTALQKARIAKGWTQAQLARNISENESLIKDYENGKGIPNVAVAQKLNRALGVKLPRFSDEKPAHNMDN